jgi:hypothetical protein
MRAVVVAAPVVCALMTPPAAGAHSRGRTIALDFRLRLIASGETVPGVQAQVVDGDREMRLTVDPRRRVVVRGLLGEPVLSFSPSGVWANRRSPTAEADRIVPPAGGGAHWTQLTHGHSYRWHDHRLSPGLTWNRAGVGPGHYRLRSTADPPRSGVGTNGRHGLAGGRGWP